MLNDWNIMINLRVHKKNKYTGDFKKIIIKNMKNIEKTQRKLLDRGCTWKGLEPDVIHNDHIDYIIINENNIMTYVTIDSIFPFEKFIQESDNDYHTYKIINANLL